MLPADLCCIRAELRTAELEDALSGLTSSLVHSEFSACLQAWRAEALLRLGRLQEAARVADENVRDPERCDAQVDMSRWWLKAQIAWHNSDLKQAVLLFERATGGPEATAGESVMLA